MSYFSVANDIVRKYPEFRNCLKRDPDFGFCFIDCEDLADMVKKVVSTFYDDDRVMSFLDEALANSISVGSVSEKTSREISEVIGKSSVSESFTAQQRRDLAAKGYAMKDGSFPIRNAEDLKNAVHDIGRCSHPELAKKHIIKRARALGKMSLIPDEWKKSKLCEDFDGDPKLDAFYGAPIEEVERWCQRMAKDTYFDGDYEITPEGINVHGSVWFQSYPYGRLRGKLPFKFNKIDKDFWITNVKLKSLENCPNYVGGNFVCANNYLKDLEFAPKYVGKDFLCECNCIMKKDAVAPAGTVIKGEFVSVPQIEFDTEEERDQYIHGWTL